MGVFYGEYGGLDFQYKKRGIGMGFGQQFDI